MPEAGQHSSSESVSRHSPHILILNPSRQRIRIGIRGRPFKSAPVNAEAGTPGLRMPAFKLTRIVHMGFPHLRKTIFERRPTAHFPALDGTRGFAVLLVLLDHASDAQ